MDTKHPLPSHLLLPRAKTAPAVFILSLNGITDAGRSLLEQAKKNPVLFGVSAVLIVGGILFLTLPAIVGFAPVGPVAGSAAAVWQGYLGSVVEGSLFAILQSLAMTGVFNTIGAAMIAAGISAAGIAESIIPLGSGGNRNYPVTVPAAVFAAYMGFRGF